jgi:hypothetical protein
MEYHLGKLSPHWLTGVPLEYDDDCNDDRNNDLSPDWLACYLGNLSPHWLIGVPLEYNNGCNDDRNTDLSLIGWSTTKASSHLIG